MKNTSRRTFLKSAAAGAVAQSMFPTALFAQAKAARCNILFIMSDDHAAHAISAYGSRINKTPNMDRLAKEGALLDHVFVTNSICTPSRACILTGMYSCKNGVPVFNDLSPEIKTIGGYMRDAGYYTAMIGKWHLGGPGKMRDQDWDDWKIYQGQGQYFDPFYFTKGEGHKKLSFPGEYASENITKVTCGVIDQARATGKPFFVMMHHKAPHRNWVPSEKYRAKFRALTLKDIPCPDSLFDDFSDRAEPIKHTRMTLEHHMRPGLDLKLKEYFSGGGVYDAGSFGIIKGPEAAEDRWPVQIRANASDAPDVAEAKRRERIKLSYLRYMQDYLACVQSVDDSVGDMLDYLKANGMDRNTLVIYTADQGFFLGDHGLYDKRFMMEETLKMPFLARCPALIKPGTVLKDIITNVDFPAMFLGVAGAPLPETFQGRSFLPNLRGKTPANWPTSCYYRYYIQGGEHGTPAHYGIRTQRYKLINYYKDGVWECFDMRKDPDELHNVYNKPAYATIIAKLKKELARLKESVGDHDQFADSTESQAK